MKLKQYPKYKESGVQWVGEIPEGWKTNRFKINCSYSKGKIPTDLFDEQTEGSLPYLSMDYLRGKEQGVLFSMDPKGVKVNDKDILLLWDGSNAGEFVISKEGILSSTMVKLKFQDINEGFSEYLCYSFEPILRDLTIGMGIPHVNGHTLGNVRIAIPPLNEQITIANFLGKKTSEIDNLIVKNKHLIELEKEKRIALINHVVTKGLDPKAKMKDSGIDWIGEIPEGWKINKVNNTGYVKGRIGWHGLTSEEYQDEGAYLVTGTDFKEGSIDWGNCHHIGWERYKEDPYIHLKKDDLLITKDGTIGKIALIKDLPDKATLNSGIFVLRPLCDRFQTSYMYWILNSPVFFRFFDYTKQGATVLHLYQEVFEKFFFPIPQKPEQQEIAEYLDKHTLLIDRTIKKVEKNIQLLEEYKKSLIHHVVTGKVDVRGVAA